jgi:hypothetical protein
MADIIAQTVSTQTQLGAEASSSVSAESTQAIRSKAVAASEDPNSIIIGNEMQNFQKKAPELYNKWFRYFCENSLNTQRHYDERSLQRQKERRNEENRN